jgi:hypothetical protein
LSGGIAVATQGSLWNEDLQQRAYNSIQRTASVAWRTVQEVVDCEERLSVRPQSAASSCDRIEFLSTGAYMASYAAVEFNDFTPICTYSV